MAGRLIGASRPLGLLLQGGGALGAWQAGALEELDRSGLRFEHKARHSILDPHTEPDEKTPMPKARSKKADRL